MYQFAYGALRSEHCLRKLAIRQTEELATAIRPSAMAALSTPKDRSFLVWNLSRVNLPFTCQTMYSNHGEMTSQPSAAPNITREEAFS